MRPASHDIMWRIWIAGSRDPRDVRGFTVDTAERAHVEKHFLNPRERWGPLAETAKQSTPEVVRGELAATDEGSPERREVDARAARAYVHTVRFHTTGAALRVAKICDDRRTTRSLHAVSQSGILCVFALGAVSALQTAYRPLPWGATRVQPTESLYLTLALRKLQERCR